MKTIKVMDTSFRDGFQSAYGARVLTKDFLPALEASVEAGITHFEAGGGARFQSLFFYCNESAFDMMDAFRNTVGPEANLQTLSRGINVVALNQQPKDIIDLHAKMFKKHGMTTIRNFDALNDINNLKYSGERIQHHGLKHEIVVAMMDLPPGCEGAHTADFYLGKLKEILDAEIPFDSVCFKDASGTANPNKVYETFKGARKMLPKGTWLRCHTHDTAGIGVSQYVAAIEGGADQIDLCRAPVSGGTCQPDYLVMMHALKGTKYQLDADIDKILKSEEVFQDAMKDYFMPPEAREVSPLITLSPMPGGALTANTMMMRDTGTLHLYPDVIKEMSDVVRKGGFGTSVTPVSQFYFQQAYANVTQGKWKKITNGYGNMVLGYFGKTPTKPDAEVVKIASEQLGKPVFHDDPLDVLEPGIPKAKKLLEDNGLETSDENIFIAASCEQKGIDFLLGKGKLGIRKNDEKSQTAKPSIKTSNGKAKSSGPQNYKITVDGVAYSVTVEDGDSSTIQAAPAPQKAAASSADTEAIVAPTPGSIVKVHVSEGESVQSNQTVVTMEAMKMETEVKSPFAGKIESISVSSGDSVQAGDDLIQVAR